MMMNSEFVQLPDFVIADIFKNCLVEFEESEKLATIEKIPTQLDNPSVEKQPPLVKYLGENRKQIVMIVEELKAATINENELEFLSKILMACNLNISDIAICNIHKQPITFATLQQQFNPSFIFLLGVPANKIELSLQGVQFDLQFHQNCTIIETPPLSGMLAGADSRLLKSKLWISLKTAFNL